MKYSKKYKIFNVIKLKGKTLLLCHILQFPISSSSWVIEENYNRISIKILMKSVRKNHYTKHKTECLFDTRWQATKDKYSRIGFCIETDIHISDLSI